MALLSRAVVVVMSEFMTVETGVEKSVRRCLALCHGFILLVAVGILVGLRRILLYWLAAKCCFRLFFDARTGRSALSCWSIRCAHHPRTTLAVTDTHVGVEEATLAVCQTCRDICRDATELTMSLRRRLVLILVKIRCCLFISFEVLSRETVTPRPSTVESGCERGPRPAHGKRTHWLRCTSMGWPVPSTCLR